MSDFIRRDGADLIVETTLINNLGNGITSGLTVTASIQRMSDQNYWDTGTPDFDSAVEGSLHTLSHVREGIYEFTLIGGVESIERAYRIHLVVTGDPQVNRNATFSDVIDVAAAPGDATLANQVLILDDTTQLKAEHITIADQNDLILSTGDAGPWTTADISAVTLADTSTNTDILGKIWDELRADHIVNGSFGEFILADVIRWAGSTTIDTVTLKKFNEIMLSYVSGRFKINFQNPGDITFFDQNNKNVVYVKHVITIEVKI